MAKPVARLMAGGTEDSADGILAMMLPLDGILLLGAVSILSVQLQKLLVAA